MRDFMPSRDHRIDLFRGLALVMIFINHIPDNILGAFTSRNFGFSDAAEAFVLLSGISAGLAYGARRAAGPEQRSVFQPWGRAFTLWLVQMVIVLCIFAMLSATLHLPGIAGMAVERNVAPVLDNPSGLLAPLLLLTHQFNCADILPLYILFLLATPMLIATALRMPLALILGSLLLWFAAGWNTVNLRTWPTDHGWFFNPLSWQLLFVIGLLIGVAKKRNIQLIPMRRWAVLICTLFLVLSALWMRVPMIEDRGNQILANIQMSLASPDFLTSFDKTYLAPLRVLHILALAYIVAAWPVFRRIAQSRPAAPIVILGRNALPVFATGSILVYLVQIVREIYVLPDLLDLVLIGFCLNIQLLVALFYDKGKRRNKALEPSPER
jgi:hypothetical protein